MSPKAILESFIYIVSSSLLYPVLALLSFLTLAVIVYAGAFCSEWIGRSRMRRKTVDDPAAAIARGDFSSFSPATRKYIEKLLKILEKAPKEEEIEYVLQENRQKLMASLDPVRILVRIGPSLGLLGTLIPMGTGLAALGQGDMTQLSSQMVIAFTTTVVGLAQGTLAYVFFTVKSRWVEKDTRDMELATDLLAGGIGRP
ncbi:MAG: MotA/TolQ/ExbB proton channel family protein [Deltaproteobacteria bacterium]